MFDLLREIYQTISNNKLRTFLTGFAVAWGIFMLIVLLGMSQGVLNGFNSFASIDKASMISVWGGFTTKPNKGYKEGRRIVLKQSDIEAIRSVKSKYIKDVYATKVLDSAKVETAKDYIANSLYGHFPAEQQRANLNMISGRFLNQKDLDEKRKVMVLESKNAKILFGDANNAVGNRVDAYGLSWVIIGVYSHDWESGTYIPFTTAMSIAGNDGNVSELHVKIHNVNNLEEGNEAEAAIRSAMASAHDFAQDDNGGVYVWNRFNNYLSQVKATSILEYAVWIIGLLTMLTGITGVSNIMFVSVRERTHEIGIRRAIGAKPRNIWLQIVTESICITTLFGYIGIVAGTLVTVLISQITKDVKFLNNPTINLDIAIKVTLVLIVTGAIAGLFPAIKATHVKPVEALRDE